jgi:Tol biopolymer transport system component
MNSQLTRMRAACAHAMLLLAALSLPAAAAIPGLELVDQTNISSYIDSNGTSFGPLAISSTGRYTLFTSAASNLVSGDTNGITDMFLHDASDDSLERVNVASDGAQANAAADEARAHTPRGGISDDGRYVVFQSAATNLVPEATGGHLQVYRRDRVSGTTTLISRGNDGLPATSDVWPGASTPDGRYTILATLASNFPDTDGRTQVYRYDANDGSLVRVTVSFDGETTNAWPNDMEISDDGRFVLFSSFADNVVPGGANNTLDQFLRDLQTATTQQVTVTDSGAPAPFSPSSVPETKSSIGRLSSDGRYAVFSTITSLTAADTDTRTDIYRFDRVTGTTSFVSTDVGGVAPPRINRAPSISSDGNHILFASMPLDSFTAATIFFVRDMNAATLTPLAIPQAQFFLDTSLALARDGSQAFINSSGLPPINGFDHVYRFDIGTTLLARLSRSPATSVGPFANGSSETTAPPSPSADGNFVAFASSAANLVTGDTNAVNDVFVRDRSGATTERISVGANGTQSACASTMPAMTPDARYVVFVSCGALAAPASGDQSEIYRYDRTNGILELVSIGASGNRADGSSYEADLSADGRYVAFRSCAANLVPATGGDACQIYVRDMVAGATVLVSRSSAGQPASAGYSTDVTVSGDGRFVGYTSYAANLVASDTNGTGDAFVFDRLASTTERVSVGASGMQGSSASNFRSFDQTGNLVLFESSSTNLAGSGAGSEQRTYLRDRSASTTTRLAIPGDTRASSVDADISPDGRFVALISYSADSGVDEFDDSRKDKLFVLDRNDGSYRALTWFTQPKPNSLTRKPKLSADGRSIAFVSTRDDLTADDGNGAFANVFIARLDDAIFKDGFE